MIAKPYYNIHQVTTGLYTEGSKYVLKDGSEYVGGYHILPNGKAYTEFVPKKNSVELFEKRYDTTGDVSIYNRITGNSVSRYLSPVTYYPVPTLDEYKKGQMQRFFVQKRNNPLYTIVEIDSEQYNKINVQNRPGINGVIWNKLMLVWKISNLPVEEIQYHNLTLLQKSEDTFRGIGVYLKDTLEFFK